MKKWFTQHPESIGETYAEHLCFASKCGFSMIGAGIACVLHAIFPFVFATTASKTMTELTDEIQKRNNQKL